MRLVVGSVAVAMLACRAGGRVADGETRALSGSAADVIRVEGPTFVGFFPPTTEAQTAASEELNTTLDDFGWHLSAATVSLRTHGYTIKVRFADTLRFQARDTSWTVVPPDSARIGYYLIVPGRWPCVAYHIRTDTELVELGAAYLRGVADCDVPR